MRTSPDPRFALVSAVSLLAATAAAQDMPPDQDAFRGVITAAREAYDGAANDLARGGERPKRGKAICEAVKDRKVKDWRRVATRYDRCPKVFLSAVALAATVMFWL